MVHLTLCDRVRITEIMSIFNGGKSIKIKLQLQINPADLVKMDQKTYRYQINTFKQNSVDKSFLIFTDSVGRVQFWRWKNVGWIVGRV